MNDWFFERFTDRGESKPLDLDWAVVVLWLLMGLAIATLVIFGVLSVTDIYLEATR